MLGRLLRCNIAVSKAWRFERKLSTRSTCHKKHFATVALASQRSPCFLATSEQATKALATVLAGKRQAGDCICLRGEVGAGKSAFSRAYVRAVEEDDTVPVPSPTYLLQNIYEYTDGPSIYHYDLYRLDGQRQLQRLDLHTSLERAVNLVEWPDRLEGLTPQERLDLEIRVLTPEEQARAAAKKGDLQSEAKERGANSSVEDEEDEVGEFADLRWRLICLQPFGHHWQQVTAFAAIQPLSKYGLHPLTPELSELTGAGRISENTAE